MMQTNKLLAGDHAQSIIFAQSGMGRKEIQYSPYGHRKELEAAPRTGFIGQYCESDLGWYFLGNGYRVYNPVIMRFHSPDVGFSPFGRGGINNYTYVTGNPIGRHDRSGHFEQDFINYINGLMGSELTLESMASYLVNSAGVVTPALLSSLMTYKGSPISTLLWLSFVTSVGAGGAGIAAQGLLDYMGDHPALGFVRTGVSFMTAFSIVLGGVQAVRDINAQPAQNAPALLPVNISQHMLENEQPLIKQSQATSQATSQAASQGRVRKRSASPGQPASFQVESEIGPTPKSPQRYTKEDLGNVSRFPAFTPSIKRKK